MNVPDGWRAALLSDVCSVGPRDPALPETAPFVPMDAVKVGVREPAYYEPRGKRGSIRAKDNDLLFARITPCLENGKVSLLPPSSGPTGGSTEFLVVRPGTNVDPRYLYLWSLNPAVRERAKAEMTGTTGRMRLSRSALGALPFPHPPLPEQRRIVELVEEHMAHLDAADASLASAEQRARALTASSRANLVSEGQRLGVDSTVGAHSTEVAYGSSSKTSDASDGVPVLRMGNIQDGQLDWSSLKYLPRDHAEFPKLLLRDGDLLFNRTNSAELVGKSAVFRGERSASYASYLIRVRFDDTVLPEWANLCINSPQGRAHVKSVLAQQVGQANVNGTKLKAFPLPVPPVEDQRRLLESADRARQEALRTTQTTHTTRRRSAALRRAVLTAAFSGHLTSTTDPSDLLQESIA